MFRLLLVVVAVAGDDGGKCLAGNGVQAKVLDARA